MTPDTERERLKAEVHRTCALHDQAAAMCGGWSRVIALRQAGYEYDAAEDALAAYDKEHPHN